MSSICQRLSFLQEASLKRLLTVFFILYLFQEKVLSDIFTCRDIIYIYALNVKCCEKLIKYFARRIKILQIRLMFNLMQIGLMQGKRTLKSYYQETLLSLYYSLICLLLLCQAIIETKFLRVQQIEIGLLFQLLQYRAAACRTSCRHQRHDSMTWL